jgi:hypothetical protein
MVCSMNVEIRKYIIMFVEKIPTKKSGQPSG